MSSADSGSQTKQHHPEMREILRKLTPEAASVVNDAIAMAHRWNHGLVTPLHVAAVLLASTSGFLYQAFRKSHTNYPNNMWFGLLEFSRFLRRLPLSTAQNILEPPPISDSLLDAIKRAESEHRCHYMRQLHPVNLEVEHLILSILDDLTVCKTLGKAGFSNSAVKATIERSLNLKLYLKSRLPQDMIWVFDILMSKKQRNPILVGESEAEAAMKELLKRIDGKDLGDGAFSNVHVLYLEKELLSDGAQIAARLTELGDLIESQFGSFFIYLGDLKWLVGLGVGVGPGRIVVKEMGRLVAKFGVDGADRLWLLGTAARETYLRFQIYHPSMKYDWDLQAVSITRLPQDAEIFLESVDNVDENGYNYLQNPLAGKGKEETYEFNVNLGLWPLLTETSEESSDRRSNSLSYEYSGPS